MIKFLLLPLFALLSIPCLAQHSIEDRYDDFNIARTSNKVSTAIEIGEQLLQDSSELSPGMRTAIYDRMAKLYEDNNQIEKAKPLYLKVSSLEPDYYVAHRALGFIYLNELKPISIKVNSSKGDPAAHKTFQAQYKNVALKAVAHLERAVACDPDDTQTVSYIKTIYQNLKLAEKLSTLDARLKQLGVNCKTIITE
ncbi:hypothetical protein GS399_11520 [Pedobacter sp. HMF7647]|uniref:Tetratricopeptide repeat protein n=1 Tax=Hufsiella arboris TaxID=2695275 RepID=A0A7K1YB66_9SPHI|nr:hypothetical protein [Hufsiella arboris]MXV51601.1 hypothetical protein [Hufsiella arboris]